MSTATEQQKEIATNGIYVNVEHRGRLHESVPVIELGTFNLKDVIRRQLKRGYGRSKIWFFQGYFDNAALVIAGNLQAAYDCLADSGAIDGWMLTEEEAREAEEEGLHVHRFGNASEPFEVDESIHVLDEVKFSAIKAFLTQVKFWDGEIVHVHRMYESSETPTTDLLIALEDIELGIESWIDVKHQIGGGKSAYVEDQFRSAIWRLIKANF